MRGLLAMALNSSNLKRRLLSSPVKSMKNKSFKSNSDSMQRGQKAMDQCQTHLNNGPFQISSCIITATELNTFLRLLDEDQHIFDFLNYDACNRLADKYLLAMVFVYFKRASLRFREYTRLNFFVALFLAHDMEEDEEELKYEILYWALGHNWQQYVSKFLQRRNLLWKRMNYRAIVSCRMCHDLISLMPSHYAWQRHRPSHHAGAVRCYEKINQTPNLLRNPFTSPPTCRLCQPLENGCTTTDAFQDLSDLADSSQIPDGEGITIRYSKDEMWRVATKRQVHGRCHHINNEKPFSSL